MTLFEWWGSTEKSLSDAEDRATRSVALLCATLHVASYNIMAEVRGATIWSHDDVIKAAKDYETYLRGEHK